MSMSFEIFPTNKKIPKCDEIIKCSAQLFSEFMHREKILCGIKIMCSEVSIDNERNISPLFLTSKGDYHTVFRLNDDGEAYVYFHELTELDREFWNVEMKENKNAQAIKEKIDTNFKVGYSWSVKRTMGQPAIVSLYYGYLAIAIAILTDGIIYSDDGAWDYACFPLEGTDFKGRYLNIETISDVTVKENIEKWLSDFKALFVGKSDYNPK